MQKKAALFRLVQRYRRAKGDLSIRFGFEPLTFKILDMPDPNENSTILKCVDYMVDGYIEEHGADTEKLLDFISSLYNEIYELYDD